MKVKDIINLRHDLVGMKTKTIVKPMGTGRNYYNSEVSNHLEDKVGEMEVEHWSMLATKRNEGCLVIIVGQDAKYEAEKLQAWKDFLERTK